MLTYMKIPEVPTCTGWVGEKKGNKKIKVVRGVFSGQGKARQGKAVEFGAVFGRDEPRRSERVNLGRREGLRG